MPNPYLLDAALHGTPLSGIFKQGFVPAGGGGDPAAAGGAPAPGGAPPAPGGGGVPMPAAPPPAGAPGTGQATPPPPVPGVDPGLAAAIQQVMQASGGGAGAPGGKGSAKDLIPQQIGEMASQVYKLTQLVMHLCKAQGMEIPDAVLLGPPPGGPGGTPPGAAPGAPGAAPGGAAPAPDPAAGGAPGGDPAAAGGAPGGAMPIAPELAPPKTAADKATAFTSLGTPVAVTQEPPVVVSVPQVPIPKTAGLEPPTHQLAGQVHRRLSQQSEAILAILNQNAAR